MNSRSATPEQSQSQLYLSGSSTVPSERIAYNAAMSQKDLNCKCDGDSEDYRSEYVDSYIQIAGDDNLTIDQKIVSFFAVLSKDATCLYMDFVKPCTTTYQQAVAMSDR